jgi:F-type H+-transporting ATPase subunit a
MIRKRYIILLCILGMIVFGSIIAFTAPVLPTIQLPGECYPGTTGIPLIGCITNTFVATILSWIIVAAIGLSLRARSRTADEVPTGFYNLFEAVIEGGLNFATNLAGSKKAKDFFPLFVTLILYILVANWMELVPTVDSIGLYEWLPHFEAEKLAQDTEAAAASIDQVAFPTEEDREAFIHQQEEKIDAENIGAFKDGIFLIKASEANAIPGDVQGEAGQAGRAPENADWTIVPFLRAAATDLNFTVALALVTMFMVQYYGFKYLGPRYLRKFFPWDINAMAKNPIKAIDPAVGLLELVGEISRIISFAFRLLGNIFAGQILLFVMAFLLPVANVAFFGLEFFVGLIQAMVFGLLGLIFMTQASESHDDHEGEH